MIKLYALLNDDGSVKSIVSQDDDPLGPHVEITGFKGRRYPVAEHERLRLVDGEVEWFDPRNTEEVAADVRRRRDSLLRETDVDTLRLLEGGGTPQQAAAMKQYRKDLRDLTKQPGFPNNVTWPTRPQ